jgi:serine transporter
MMNSKAKSDRLNEVKKIDRAWIFTFFGTAIGAGILFLPVQAGLAGLIVVVGSMIMAIAVTYFAQKFYSLILVKTKNAHSYNGAIKEYWGPTASSVISILFSIQLFGSLLIYATALNTDIGEFLYAYKMAPVNLSGNPICSFIILAVFTVFMILSEKILIKFLSKLTYILIFLLIIVSLLFIPFWSFDSAILTAPLDATHILKNILLCFPLFMGALVFYMALSPMVMYYRKNYPENSLEEQEKKVVTLNKKAIYLLSAFTVVFVISSALTLTPEGIEYALKNNISSLAVLGIGSTLTPTLQTIRFLSYIVIFFALTTSFYGVALGLIELLSNQIRFPEEWSDEKRKRITAVGMMLLIWVLTTLNINILSIMGYFSTPFNGFILFIVPTLIIYTCKSLEKYRRISTAIILGVGLFTTVSFFLGSLM